jgi:peptidoglycan/xylan/chitin deacetylase (PgdA/CDA1 family)
MRKPTPRSRRVLGLGLAALLTPAVIAGCGSLPAQRTSADADRTTAAAVTHGTAGATASTRIPAQRTAPATPSPGATATTPTGSDGDGAPDAPASTAPASPASTAGSPSASATTPTANPSGHQSRIIRTTASGGRTVALTFDDGPGPATRPILDLLAEYHVHATFCEVGQEVTRDPGVVGRILAEGHRLCDHTVDHPQPMHTQPHDRQVHEIADAQQSIVDAGGPGTHVAWFRAPGGDFSADNEQIAADHGMRSLGWSVDPRDWSRPGVPAIVANVQQHVRPGSVVLMHDGGGDRSQTVAALRQLLPWLVAQGYTFDFPAGG